MLHDKTRAHLVIVDVQERLLPAIEGGEKIVANCRILLKAARELEIPISATEQYVKGLGATVDGLKEALGNAPRFDKMHFSAGRDGDFIRRAAQLAEDGRSHVVIAGTEAHVCVLQTALDMLMDGFTVSVVADAVGSRKNESRDLAFARMRSAGVTIATTEMVVFEWLEEAGTDSFKVLHKELK